MNVHALMSLGFLGFASIGFDGGVPSPADTAAGTPIASHFNVALVRSPLVESRAPATPGIFIPLHKPSHFPFVTIVADDGKGKGGGWQAAKASLPFQKFGFPLTLITWYCPITIEMPIRNSISGYISPATAATMSAQVTNSVASGMAAGTDFDLPQGIFCGRFVKGVEAAFPSMYPNLGVRVSR